MKIQSLFNRYTKDNFSVNTLIFFIIINSGNFFSYIFQFTLARLTSIENFGLYNSISSILMYFSAIVATLPYFVTKTLSDKNNSDQIWNYLFLIIFIVNLFILIFHFFILEFLKFDNNIYFIYIYVIINLSILLSFLSGFLQFNKNYNKFSILISLQMFFRFLVLIFFYYIFKNISVHHALLSNLAPIFIILLIAFYFSFEILKSYKFSLKLIKLSVFKKFFNEFFPIYLNNLLIIFILASDIVLIKLKFDLKIVGIFSASAILAKIIFYLPSALSIISYSENLKNLAINKLKIIFLLLNTVSIFVLFIYMLFGSEILTFSFGSSYAEAHPFLILNSFCYLILANIVLFNYVFLSRNNIIQIYYTAFMFILSYSICYLFIDDIILILKIILFSNAVILCLNLIQMFKNLNKTSFK